MSGLGFRVWGLGFGVSGLGFRAKGLEEPNPADRIEGPLLEPAEDPERSF